MVVKFGKDANGHKRLILSVFCEPQSNSIGRYRIKFTEHIHSEDQYLAV